MPSDYYTLITAAGAAKLATAIDDGTHVPLTHLAVGSGENDAPYEPVSTQTALKNENYRVGLQDVSVHPDNANWVVINAAIPPEEGGWHIREIGIFDQAGDMFAIAKVPEIYKPVLAQGSGSDIDLKIILEIGNADTVQMQVDPSTVYAPKSWVTQQITNHKASRDHPDGTEAAKGFLQLATVPEHLDGVENGKATHPEGVAAMMDDLLTEHEQTSDHPNATTTVKGFVELATVTEAKTGTDATRAVTPAGVKAAIDDRLGGLMIVVDQKAEGTDGGSATIGARQTRDLNTVRHNTITGASLAANQITLPAGTYEIEGTVPAVYSRITKSWLRNVSDGADAIIGTAVRSQGADGQRQTINSLLTDVVTIAAQKVFRIEQEHDYAVPDHGLGIACGHGSPEVYTTIKIRKIS